MKKIIITTSLVIIAALLLIRSGGLSALIMFILMGQIPGTSYSISPSVMLLLLGVATALVLYRVTIVKVLHSANVRRLIKKHLAHKARMPRRRYSQI